MSNDNKFMIEALRSITDEDLDILMSFTEEEWVEIFKRMADEKK